MENIIVRKLLFSDLVNFDNLSDNNDYYFKAVLHSKQFLLENSEYPTFCFVAYDSSTLVGFIYGVSACKNLYLQLLYVKESYRNIGIGKRLLNAIEQYSECDVAIGYFAKELSHYYQKQNYEIGNNLIVGVKSIVKKRGNV